MENITTSKSSISKWVVVNCIISLIITSPIWGGDTVNSIVGYEMSVGIVSTVLYVAQVVFLFIYSFVMMLKNPADKFNANVLAPLVSAFVILVIPLIFRLIAGSLNI